MFAVRRFSGAYRHGVFSNFSAHIRTNSWSVRNTRALSTSRLTDKPPALTGLNSQYREFRLAPAHFLRAFPNMVLLSHAEKTPH
jgi:hypothetical protein